MEQVLVVPRKKLLAGGGLEGFSPEPGVMARFLKIVRSHGYFVPRLLAEEDEDLKQIVPYGVVFFWDRVFLFRRGKGGVEIGLRGRWSLGLGGHVNPEDGTGPSMLERALLREMAEEVSLEQPRLKRWGVLNDDRDEVGRRHFGFVYRVWATSPVVVSREAGKIQGFWASLQEAQARRPEMESWSQIVLEVLLQERGEVLIPGPG